jgi:hypothetical protein
MTELYLRQGTTTTPSNSIPKDDPLTNVEVDSNFVNLNAEVVEASEAAVAMSIALGG